MKTRRRKAAESSNSSPSTSAIPEIRPETIDEDVSEDSVSKIETKTKKRAASADDDDDDDDDGSSSDSSIGDYLKSTDKIDLNSSFFKIDHKKPTDFATIEKNILSNVDALSDTEESAADVEEVRADDDPVENVGTSAPESGAQDEIMRFEQLEEYTKKLEDVKSKLATFSSNLSIPKEKLDIGQLLAAGETVNEEISCDLSGSDDGDVSDSEMEEVEEKSALYHSIPKEGVQITLNVPLTEKQKKKSTDIMMVIKRKINKVKKECQVYVHKVHLLCWVAHGNFLNSIINDPVLLGMALSLIPSQHCYPKDRTDLGYLEQITKWYVKLIKVKEKEQDEKSYEMPLNQALKTQINKKEVYLKRDLVLIFVCMMRSLGVQCRLVVSFRVLPLRPPSSELCSLSTKSDNVSAVSSKKDGETSKKNLAKKPLSTLRNEQKPAEKKSTVKKEEKTNKNPVGVKTNGSKSTKTTLKKGKKETVADTKVPQVDGSSDPLKITTGVNEDGLRSGPEQGNRRSLRKRAMDAKNSNVEFKKIPQVDGANDLLKEKSIKAPKTTSKTQKKDLTRPVADGRESKRKKVEGNDLLKEKAIETADLDSKSEKLDPAGDENNIRPRKQRSKKPVKYMEIESDEECHQSGVKKMKTKANTKSVIVDPNETTSSFFKNVDSSPVKETQRAIKKVLRFKNPESPKIDKDTKTVNTKTVNTKTVIQGGETSHFFAKDRRKIKTAISKMKKVSNTANDIIKLVKQRIVEQKHIDRMKQVAKKGKEKDDDDDEDSDYVPEPVVKKRRSSQCDNSDDDFDMNHKQKINSVARKSKKNDRRVLSTDEDNDEQMVKKSTKVGNDFWVEVFLEAEEKWIPVDVIKGRVHCVSEIFSRATQPVTYIVAWNNNNSLKDVTSRYCKNWNTVTRKLRVDKDWWNETLKPYIGKKTARDKEEDEDLARQQLDQPLPTTISEYKNHPLYALKRHLLKFEAIYPPDAVTLGFVRNEPVYARECVYTLHSRETWIKQARVVKLGEKPYKIVKARPKYDKLSGNVISDIPLEVFGLWQTQDYVPPAAENGIVPRNAYGNVDLFKPCMLPKGTVHLQLPGLNRVARKLGIDCASAMVGFDYHSGGSHPAFDGFVVCEEFKDTLVIAWEQEQQEAEKRAQEKIENRVYGNWKKLIKGLLIRERLKAKYGFGEPSSSNTSTKKKKPKEPRFHTKKK